MRSAIAIGALALAATLVGGCATKEEKQEVNQRIQAEDPVAADESFANRGANLFVDAKGVTDEQRQKLLQVHTTTYQKAGFLRDEITKTKSALFKSLLDPAVSKKEINLMKKRVVSLDRQRLDVMLGAFDEVQKVVGRGSADRSVYEPFMLMDSDRAGAAGHYPK